MIILKLLGLDPGCPTSDAYTELCENAGGKICGPNSIGNDECCRTIFFIKHNLISFIHF